MRYFFPAAGEALAGSYRAFAGLRVLPSGAGHAFSRSRETSLLTDRRDRPRLISVAGGKLTAYRATAKKVMRRLRGSLPPADIPQDIAIELSKLDPGEVSTALTRSGGETLVFLMLCARNAPGVETASYLEHSHEP